jgi:crotonobetainyl-CoA:carnitine CoA-transferase CaiB-like acyl-CoA transferase
MAAPLDGIKVLEVANWLAAPAAAALMADMGADVIKVEPPTGDIFRGFILRSIGYDFDFQHNYAFEVDNRGKRSIVVDLDKPGGPETVRKLAADCDVFLTNLVQRRRVRYGLTFEEVKAANPKVIYASFSGYGTHGPDEDRPGFDFAAFWARSGIMSAIGEPDAAPAMCRGGQGDHTTALNILAAVLAALRMRDKTGEGQHVEVTLQGTGMYTIAGDFSAALTSKKSPARISRKTPVNPIWNTYRTSDDRWILTVMPVPFPQYWPKFCDIIEKPEWANDERWNDLAKLRANTPMLVQLIDEIIAAKPYSHWSRLLDQAGLIWAPVATMADMIADPQVREMGWITELEHPTAGKFETLDTPFRLYGSDTGARGPAPALGDHTFEVLSAAGFSEDELANLAEAGVLG